MQLHQDKAEAAERLRRQEHIRDTRAGLALGIGVEEYVALREASEADWATWMHAEMSKQNAESPEQIMPQILARMEQRCAQISREAAKIAATQIVQERLKKAIT